MKNKIIFTVLIIILTFHVTSCQSNITKINEESLSIINLLYNIESNKFPVPPPPNGDASTNANRAKIKTSDKYINNKKYVIAVIEKDNKEYIKVIDLPKEYSEILSNSASIFLSKNLLKAKIEDVNGNKIPVIVPRKSLKIQDIAKKNEVLGVLFLSDIKFNENINKAVLQFGAYTHELAGYTSIICLEKKQGSWQVVSSKNLSES